MSIRAILFDLDDTLYPEHEFVESGFHTVARHLVDLSGRGYDEMYQRLMTLLEERGRGCVFDLVLDELGLCDDVNVARSVYLYRTHTPIINPYPEAVSLLRDIRARAIAVGLITDGMGSVQRRKIEALDIQSLFDLIICTDEIGPDYWKPSPLPYELALQTFGISPAEAVYIGNDVSKDFAGANQIGMTTIQIGSDPGPESELELTYQPDFHVPSLGQLNQVLDIDQERLR